MESKDHFKRAAHSELGPGGVKCPCCGPAPGKARDEFRRRARRRMKHELPRLLQPELEETITEE